MTRRDDEPTIGRERHSIDRLSDLAQVVNPFATWDRPDRRVAFGAAG